MCEPNCDCDSWFYAMPRSDSWRRACIRACKKHPANSCKPLLTLQRKFDPNSGPGIRIWKRREPLPIYEEALKILRQERYPLPLEDPDFITWPPPQNGINSFSYKDQVPAPSILLVLEIPCKIFASSLATYGTKFLALERKTNPATQTHTKPFI